MESKIITKWIFNNSFIKQVKRNSVYYIINDEINDRENVLNVQRNKKSL